VYKGKPGSGPKTLDSDLCFSISSTISLSSISQCPGTQSSSNLFFHKAGRPH
jgi:hypothetical protein